MPHIHLETTADLPENAAVPDILEALVAELSLCETVSPKSIKAYHSLRSVWQMGEGAPAGFAHCTIAILDGRTMDLRTEIAHRLYKVLAEQFAESLGSEEVSLTLEVREMTKETYVRA